MYCGGGRWWWDDFLQLLAICRGFEAAFGAKLASSWRPARRKGKVPLIPAGSGAPRHQAGDIQPFFSASFLWLRDLGPDWRSHSWDLSLSFPVPLLRGAPAHPRLCFCSESCRLDSPFLTSPCCSKGPADAGGSWAGGGTVQEQKHGKRAASPAEALLCLPSCLPRCFWLRVSKS